MFLTEKEAKTKRCQESFGDTSVGSGFMEPRPAMAFGAVGMAIATSPQCCIGSACMAWRWHYDGLGDDPNTLGYCGKAGKP
jgi:hypothetical protein